MHSELIYWRRRLAEETAAAAAAESVKAKSVHLELARRYGERIGALESSRESARRVAPLHLVSAA